jgi:hypothetical protein
LAQQKLQQPNISRSMQQTLMIILSVLRSTNKINSILTMLSFGSAEVAATKHQQKHAEQEQIASKPKWQQQEQMVSKQKLPQPSISRSMQNKNKWQASQNAS